MKNRSLAKTIKMKTTTLSRALATAFGACALALLLAPNVSAQCGGLRPLPTHTNWQLQLGQPHLLPAAYLTTADEWRNHDEPIVGFWHVKFLAGSTEIDAGYAQWHSDGTEIMNSGSRPPQSGDFCLGVWKKVGERRYKLNHFAAAWDPTGSELLGPANIREDITLKPDGLSFSGTFSIEQYDEKGNSLGGVQGTITGARINVDTPPQSIF